MQLGSRTNKLGNELFLFNLTSSFIKFTHRWLILCFRWFPVHCITAVDGLIKNSKNPFRNTYKWILFDLYFRSRKFTESIAMWNNLIFIKKVIVWSYSMSAKAQTILFFFFKQIRKFRCRLKNHKNLPLFLFRKNYIFFRLFFFRCTNSVIHSIDPFDFPAN